MTDIRMTKPTARKHDERVPLHPAVAVFVMVSFLVLTPLPSFIPQEVGGASLGEIGLILAAIFMIPRRRDMGIFASPAVVVWLGATLLITIVALFNGVGLTQIVGEGRHVMFLGLAAGLARVSVARSRTTRQLLLPLTFPVTVSGLLFIGNIVGLWSLNARVHEARLLTSSGRQIFGNLRLQGTGVTLAATALLGYWVAHSLLNFSSQRGHDSGVSFIPVLMAGLLFVSANARNQLLLILVAILLAGFLSKRFGGSLPQRIVGYVRRLAKLAIIAALVVGFAAIVFAPVRGLATAYYSRAIEGSIGLVTGSVDGSQLRDVENAPALQSFKDSPLYGLGWGSTYRDALRTGEFGAGASARWIHNTYYRLAAKGGLVMLGSFALLFFRPLWRSFRRPMTDRRHDQVRLAATAALTGLLMAAYAAPALLFTSGATIGGLLLALTQGLSGVPRASENAPTEPGIIVE